MKHIIMLLALALLLASIANAQEEPEAYIGLPEPYSWTATRVTLWWPNSSTPRGDEWKCLARVVNFKTNQWFTLEFWPDPIPVYTSHRFMYSILNFSYWGPARWSLRDGSCFILNEQGSVIYTVPITGLPWSVDISKGKFVYVPMLSDSHRRVTR